MKINEIIMEAPGQSGQNPALQSEAKRAQVEYKTLKKFSPQFANEFMQAFRLLGSNSVDAAYQAAAEKAGVDVAGRSAVANIEGMDTNSAEYRKAIQTFRSALPDAWKKTQVDYKTSDPSTSGYYGNKNAEKSLTKTAKAVWQAAKDLKISNAVDMGQAVGNAAAKRISAPVVTSKAAGKYTKSTF